MNSIILDGSFVHIPISPTLKTKVKIIKGEHIDTYTILKEKERNVFPLQYGNGLYSIKVYQNVRGNRYSLTLSQTLNATDTSQCWLKPSQLVWYSDDVKELAEKIKADNPGKGISAFYDYCYQRMGYDYVHAFLHKKDTNYLPDLSKIIHKKNGICFDKAALFCALCRSTGIECKLVIGYVNQKTYHAWCQVKMEGKWRTVDPTLGKKYKVGDYKVERIS